MAARPPGAAVLPYLLAFLFGLLTCARVHGAVGVVLNESLHESLDRITGTGHSAVYFSRICAESPVKLRMCHPGELGSVMSIYINIGEDHPFGWNVVPLNIYLYGVEDARNRPLFGSNKIKHALEERYRANYLSEYCASPSCRTSDKAEWREMVAATLIRGVYLFVVDTPVEQDRQLIAEFNDSANQNRFNGATYNCADFARKVINSYFPHAVSRDYINDFGMTSPKAVARTFTRYALRHPECNFRVMHFAQVPGTIKRSSEVRAGTEQLFHSKKLLIPMIIFASHELPVVIASYVFTGRFNPEREFERHPAAGPEPESPPSPPLPQATAWSEERIHIVGTPSEWQKYHDAFDSIVEENKNVVGRRELKRFFNHLDQEGTASVDNDGAAWMELSVNGAVTRVGVSSSNALPPGSNAQLSYKLFLARAATFLKSAKHRRETLLEFQQDWAALQRASVEISAISGSNADPVQTAPGAMVPVGAMQGSSPRAAGAGVEACESSTPCTRKASQFHSLAVTSPRSAISSE